MYKTYVGVCVTRVLSLFFFLVLAAEGFCALGTCPTGECGKTGGCRDTSPGYTCSDCCRGAGCSENACSPGKYCPGGTGEIECPAGKWSGSGASSCTACAAVRCVSRQHHSGIYPPRPPLQPPPVIHAPTPHHCAGQVQPKPRKLGGNRVPALRSGAFAYPRGRRVIPPRRQPCLFHSDPSTFRPHAIAQGKFNPSTGSATESACRLCAAVRLCISAQSALVALAAASPALLTSSPLHARLCAGQVQPKPGWCD